MCVLHHRPFMWFSTKVQIQTDKVCSDQALHVLYAMPKKHWASSAGIVHFVWLELMVMLTATAFPALQVIPFTYSGDKIRRS